MAASNHSALALVLATVFLSGPARAETTLYAGVQYDTDKSAAQCWLSNRSGDLKGTGNVGIRHNLFSVGRWTFTLKAEHVSCFRSTDNNDTNSVGVQIEFDLL